jgi:hypothetical protein
MSKCHFLPLGFVLLQLAAGCDVYPVGAARSGIAGLEQLPQDECGRGFLVVSSDYQSSNVSAIDRQGNWLSPSLASSSLAEAGLVQAFSGDVVLPTERQQGDIAVLIDRYPQSVLSFVDLGSADIRVQLDVSTGFAANPHDALRLNEDRILVTRFDSNLEPGAMPYDNGGDLLLLDVKKRQILSRLDLRSATPKATASQIPHPERLLRAGSRIFVVVSLYSPDYRQTGPSYLVGLDTDTLGLTSSLELTGVAGCAGLSLAPNGAELAVVCSGGWGSAAGAQPQASGLVGIDITATPTERWKLLATSLSPALPFGFSVAHASNERILTVALGYHADVNRSAQSDRFVSYDVKTKKAEVLYIETGKPFSLGDVSCLSRCGRCALANANGRGRLMLFQETYAGLSALGELASDEHLGLPPRWLGTF